MNPVYHYDIVQGSPEWHELRAGRIGGSESAALLSTGKSSLLSVAAYTLLYRNAAELITGPNEPTSPNAAMQRGIDLEGEARRRYEDLTFQTAEQVGYISVGDYFGYSPDGLVGDSGLIEIKCPLAPEYVRFLDTRQIDPGHMAQMQWGMFLTGRVYCDYIVYHPEFEPADMVIEKIGWDERIHALFTERCLVYASEMNRILSAIAKHREE